MSNVKALAGLAGKGFFRLVEDFLLGLVKFFIGAILNRWLSVV